MEGSIAARGDLWRVEASRGGSTSGNENSSLFLVQLGPLLFVRDSTLLLPIHLSKQHLLWYGYDRKVKMRSCQYYSLLHSVKNFIFQNFLCVVLYVDVVRVASPQL